MWQCSHRAAQSARVGDIQIGQISLILRWKNMQPVALTRANFRGWRIPCLIPRKKIKREDIRKNKNFLLSELTVTPVGMGEWAGFAIDGDHLFLLSDGTVTHNSWGAVEAILERCKTEPILVVCAREYQNTLEDSVYRLMLDSIRRMGLSDWFTYTKSSIKSHAGAEIIFKGLNDADSLKSLEGCDICLVEEAQSVAKDSLKGLIPQCASRVQKSGCCGIRKTMIPLWM